MPKIVSNCHVSAWLLAACCAINDKVINLCYVFDSWNVDHHSGLFRSSRFPLHTHKLYLNHVSWFCVVSTSTSPLFVGLQLELVKTAKDVEAGVQKRCKENVYMVIVEGFQLLSEWTGRMWEQSAWKFSRPAKDAIRFDIERTVDVTDYEKVKPFCQENEVRFSWCIAFAVNKSNLQSYWSPQALALRAQQQNSFNRSWLAMVKYKW